MDRTELGDLPPETGHEPGDFHAGAALGLGVGVALLTGLALLVAYWLFVLLDTSSREAAAPPSPLAAGTGQVEATRPAAEPAEQLHLLHEYEDATLGSYGWVDREKGLVHIPLEEAMELYLQRASANSEKETEKK